MNYTSQEIASKYVRMMTSAKSRGIKFDLPLQSLINVCRAKKCFYTGKKLTKPTDSATLPTDLTVERIDPKKGYEKGNVCAISHEMNSLKSQWEHKISPEKMISIANKMIKARAK